MSKKKSPAPSISNRLESLFSDLGQEKGEAIRVAPPGVAVSPDSGKHVTLQPASEQPRKGLQPGAAPEAVATRSPARGHRTDLLPPSNSLILNPNGSKPPHPTAPAHGFLSDAGQIVPANSILTSAGQESLIRGNTVLQNAKTDQPAVMALSFPFEEQNTLLLEVLDDSGQRQWSEDERLLVEEVADQLSLALENARLFEQTQSARDALEVRERYQKSVAQAVTMLSEHGTQGLKDVLRLLGEAAQVSRAYYFETLEDERGLYWRPTVEWTNNGIASQINNPELQRLSIKHLAYWSEPLRREGRISAHIIEFPPRERAFLQSLGTRSLLQFAVPGKLSIPGIFGFDQCDYERIWGVDEIAALQTAASALANTIAREDLFAQVQASLAETETLYQASGELNAAQTYVDILSILRKHTLLGEVDSNISLNLFNRPWQTRHAGSHGEAGAPTSSEPESLSGADEMPEWVNVIGRWSLLPAGATMDRYPLRSFPAARQSLSPNQATLIEDIASDPRLDDNSRALYVQRFKASSTIFVPLVVGGQWIGFINAFYSKPYHFPEAEVRRVMMLSSQAAVVIQNLQSLSLAKERALEAQKRSEELALINRVVASVASSLDLRTSLNQVARELGEALSVQSGITLLNEERQVLTLVASYTPIPDGPAVIGLEIPLEGNPSSQQVISTRETLIIDDPQYSPLTEPIHDLMRQRGIETLMIVPLIAGNRAIGTVGLDILEPGRTFTIEEIRLAETIILQVATAIENARLFEQTELALSETETLYQASAALNATETYDDILSVLRQYSVLGQNANHIIISTFERPWVTGEAGQNVMQPEWSIPIASWPCGAHEHVSQNRLSLASLGIFTRQLSPTSPTLILDTSQDSRVTQSVREQFVTPFLAQSLLFAPLLVSGRWIGLIYATFEQIKQFSEVEVRRLMTLTSQAAVAIQNIHLLEESRRRADQLQTAAEIARDTSSTLALDALLQRTVHLILERFGYYHASIFLLDESGKNAVIRESTGPAGEEMKRQGHRLAVGSRSIIGQVTASGVPLVVNDVNQDPVHRPNPLLPLTRAELGIPMKTGERVTGALDVQSTIPNAFTPDDISVLQTLADQITVAIDNARAYELAQKAVEEMREVDRLKSQFLANMSHELRTPLNSIIGFSRVILKGIDGPVNDIQKQDLNAIYNSGQHLLGLINDVLDLSKIEAGKMELSFEDQVNLADMINSVMSTTIGLVKDKPISLFKVIPEDLPTVRADPMKVRQILINLLSNAAKFTEEGSITIEAGVQPAPNGSREVIIKVIDTGAGIAEEDQSRLFQAFSQVDGSLTRKTGGTGLGLSICRHLVEMHGGRIDLNSEVDKGSTFYFTLPLSPAKEEIREKNRAILVVDDRQVMNLFERYLSNHNYRAIPLSNLRQVVARTREVQPFAISLDVALQAPIQTGQVAGSGGSVNASTYDGWQVLRELKSDPVTRDIPVMICTMLDKDGFILEPQGPQGSLSRSTNKEKGFRLGAAAYLMKPILEDDLIHAISQLAVNDGQDNKNNA